MVMDGSPRHMESVRAEAIYWRHDLTAVCAFVDRSNVCGLITKSGFAGQTGILSIDIDGNDYWVWEAIDCVDADIVVCEYNGVFGDIYPITIPYRRDFLRAQAHRSNLYYGASISALCFLARHKGYTLVGTNRAGTNAFFVRDDFFPLVAPAIKHKVPRPSLVRESRGDNGMLTFISGLDRLREIGDLPVVRVDTGESIILSALSSPYSLNWLCAMGIH
jgi:hypothetical protein